MSNELIPTNGLWYKIKKFLKSIFFKEKHENIEFVHRNDLRENFKKDNAKHILAEKLLYGEIGTSQLNETEVDEMTEYFKKDIENIDNELSRIKQHILSMQHQLK